MLLFKPHQYRDWYIICTAQDLRDSLRHPPISRTVLGIPLVLFRGSHGQAIALLDRCPHRNVPLSLGKVERHTETASHRLICRYHGWEFDEQGHCQNIPGLCPLVTDPNQRAIAYPTVEQQGFVWVYPTVEAAPSNQPYRFPWGDQPQFSTFGWQRQAPISRENVAENFLDATHTHFVHGGLIRTAQQRRPVTVKITRGDRQVEAIYRGEQQISGLIYRLLAPGCREVISIGRFLLPGVAQIEYQTDRDDYRLLISLFITPINPKKVQIYSVTTFRWGRVNWLGRLIGQPLFHLAMRQDLNILLAQAKNLERFGGEQFTFTSLDLLRPHINYLLQKPDEPASQSLFKKTISIQL